MRKLRQSIGPAMALVWALGATMVLAGASGAAQARSPFDGRWLVVIRSPLKHCHASANYTLRIRNGRVTYRGLAPLRVHGRVDRRGKVVVRLSGGGQSARAAGRLWKHTGTGIWRGRKYQRTCRGKWWAKRH